MTDVPPEHGRFDYSAIVDRPKLVWPNGARVAVWTIPNLEHFLFDRPATPISMASFGLKPDVLNYGWRDYGLRVGFWRMREIMDRYGFKGTVALNSQVCELYPRVIEAGLESGWEWMGHGITNSVLLNDQSEEEERAIIAQTVATIAHHTGRPPRGWLGPVMAETVHTLDLLAEHGIDYVADWVNDEQPYPMRVRSGRMTSIPYSAEMNDIPTFLDMKQSAETYAQNLMDQFDVLYEDGATTGRVMAIPLHPFLVGHPYRAKHFARALEHISSRNDVWIATGSEIIDWYLAGRPQKP
ncbi:polysaccharide deacetylase family protein [Pelagibacterium lacus]|uniref:Chitooligosaccharide deacetylase n=1 Tax=Pelagibacterium lacus TaxID=2282655 RepID=A0A369W9X7_9HYPH|nr:polysaccharide deacetylase family protein [Pelagibacterium lacus]RDE10072.1 polysaccharide deacetylase [Pelagibacterium lacus]